MSEDNSRDDAPAAYAPLTVYVYPEGDHWVAATFGYDLKQKAPQSNLAANLLVKALLKLGWVTEKQGFVMRKLRNEKEFEQTWLREYEDREPERRALKEVFSRKS